MITELLFGDMFEILELKKKWVRIRMEYDRYEGWIGNAGYNVITEEQFEEFILANTLVTTELVSILSDEKSDHKVSVLCGSSLPKPHRKRINIANHKYLSDSLILDPAKKTPSETIISAALRYLGSPYTWGGRNPFGIDCSGLVQMAYKQAAVRLPRDAGDQAQAGETLSFIDEALPGDLAFFDDENGKIIHTGIIIGNGEIIHSSGFVRIDKIDHQGIYNRDTQSYSHKLRLLKRII